MTKTVEALSNIDISNLSGVGPELIKKLAILGIKTTTDLIINFPRRYDDYSNVSKIKDISPGLTTLEVKIGNITSRYVRRGMHITEALATDDSGSLKLIWFNQPYRANSLKTSQVYFVAGDYQLSRTRFSIINPSVELSSDFPINTARIIPIYRETKGLKSFQIRKLIKQVLALQQNLPEILPNWILEINKLCGYFESVSEVHFPSSADNLEKARHRLGFDEIFQLSLAALLNKYELLQEKALAISFNEPLAVQFVKSLPFSLTDAQRRVAWSIYQDMVKTQPMNRLVEGDVGSGKTVVAAMAAIMAIHEGFQVALMAPTEILAKQHAETLGNLLQSVGYQNQVGLLVGSLPVASKMQISKAVSSGDIKLIVGTHALIQDSVDMHNLGLIIVDEQHRFGVEQRKKLQAKAGHMPHVLHMSATPIPRSLALTLYGELDISVLDEMPPGRSKIITKMCSPNSKAQLYEKIDLELAANRQMFVVCPLIAESDAIDAMSVEKVYNDLTKKIFKHRKVGLLHGKMKAVDKDLVMQKFIDKKIDILVSTTVIEVGIDVPNASVMLIEGAERFGLAQIHQLRGRVGRGSAQSYCYLMPSSSKAPISRLRSLETVSDGFKLAEIDLLQRGPGAIYGTFQHGALDLRIAKLTDVALISAARKSAQEFIDKSENLLQYSQLADNVIKLRAVTNLN